MPIPKDQSTSKERDDTGVTDAENNPSRIAEPFAIPEFYVDGFTAVYINGDIVRCVGFSMQPDGRALNAIAVIRLVMSEESALRFSRQIDEAFSKKKSATRTFGRKRRG